MTRRPDARAGLGEVRAEIERAIERHPEHVLMTAHLARVVSTGELFGRRWGHEVCTSVTFDHPVNAERVANGSPLNAHFRAYNADLETTRRCCTGVTRSCETCFDTWEHFSWVMLEMRSHLKTERDFVDWLSTTWLFYFINRIIDVDEGARLLPRLQRRALPSACALAR